jgi:hypothetical protein
MFNTDLKNKALERLKKAETVYNEVVSEVQEKAKDLFEYRKSICKDIIESCENYINNLTNSPKEFGKSLENLVISYEKFESVCRNLVAEDNTSQKSGLTAIGGITVGAGVAAFAPSAAMAIATTFGTASTGAAISTLTGAAATNAALAWIGGGALATGGGGMVAGNALLALAGPIGWAIGGTTLIGSSVFAWVKNKNLAEKATDAAIKIETAKTALEVTNRELNELISLTTTHVEAVISQLEYLQDNAPLDYSLFDADSNSKLQALITNINSLSMIVQKKLAE